MYAIVAVCCIATAGVVPASVARATTVSPRPAGVVAAQPAVPARGPHLYPTVPDAPLRRAVALAQLSGGRGTVGLYLRAFSLPTPFANVCGAVHLRKAVVCEYPNPGVSYYFGLYGVTDYSKVKLKFIVKMH